jgi:protein-disulfide isomerase
MSNRQQRRHANETKKRSWTTWLIVGLIAVAIAGGIFYNANKGTGVDYTPYSYTDDAYDRGADAVLVEEFSDFQCPYCQQLAPTMHTLREMDNVRFEYKHFPIRTAHPFAQKAAEAAECARDQNKFWAYHDVLFDSKKLDERSLKKHAEGLGLNTEEFEVCLDSDIKAAVINDYMREGQARSVQGTPTVFVNGTLFNGRTLADFNAVLQ